MSDDKHQKKRDRDEKDEKAANVGTIAATAAQRSNKKEKKEEKKGESKGHGLTREKIEQYIKDGTKPSEVGKSVCECGKDHWRSQCTGNRSGQPAKTCTNANSKVSAATVTTPMPDFEEFKSLMTRMINAFEVNRATPSSNSSQTPFNADGTTRQKTFQHSETAMSLMSPDMLHFMDRHN